MFKVIVWATDGSSAAAHALPYVKSLVQTDRSRLVVMHVDEFGVGRAVDIRFTLTRPRSKPRFGGRWRT
jgi:hypothetical protein